MKRLGIALWIGGAALAAFAFFLFDPSINVGRYGVGRVVNLDLQQRQLMMTVAGCAAFVAGVVLHALAGKASDKKPSAPRVGKRTGWIERGRANPINDGSISDEELAEQEADARAFMARQRS